MVKNIIAGAAIAATAAALPQIVTTVTEPRTTTITPFSGYTGFGFPSLSGYGGYRPYNAYNPYSSYGSSYGYGYNPYSNVVGSQTLGFGFPASSTTFDGQSAPYVYAFPGDVKRTDAEKAGDVSMNIADSKTTLTKRQFGAFGNIIANGWENFLDSLGYDRPEPQSIVVPAGSVTLGGITPSFTIDNGYPAPAFPAPAYPGASYSGPAVPLVYPNAASSGSQSFTITKKD